MRELTKLPLIAKINAVYRPVVLSAALKSSGVNGIVCSNSIPASVRLNGKIYHGGLSGPAIKPVVLRAVGEISAKAGIDVAACGGIISIKDVEDYKAAGAKAFVLGSALLKKPEMSAPLTDRSKK